jgi:hypothetical protein
MEMRRWASTTFLIGVIRPARILFLGTSNFQTNKFFSRASQIFPIPVEELFVRQDAGTQKLKGFQNDLSPN